MMLVKVVAVPPNSDMLSKGSHDVCFICGNRGINQSYHKIPTSSPIREKWLQALKINEYNSSVRVCSIHFPKEDFRELDKKILHENAIPSKLLTVRFGETKLAQTMQKCNKKCCVCGAKDSSLTYHTFPAEPNLRKKWADACGFKDHLFLRTKQICGKHFQREDYNYCMKINPKADKSRRTLKKDVVPSLELGGNASERKNVIINIPPPYRPLAPKSNNTLVFRNLNDMPKVAIPPSFRPITPICVNPAVLSSLCVVLGNQNTNHSNVNPKTTQVNLSSTKTPAQYSSKSSTLAVKPVQTKSSEVIELNKDAGTSVNETNATSNSSAPVQTNSTAFTRTNSSISTKTNSMTHTKTKSSVPTETNRSASSKSDSNDSKIDEDNFAVLADDENSNFSLEEFVLEEALSDEENEVNSNSESNNQPTITKDKRAKPIVRSSLPTKYRPILPAPTLTVENIKLIEALALKNGLRTDHSYERKPLKLGPPLLWRYPSDIGPSHCNTPTNAWRAVQILKSTIEKQKAEIRGLQQFKRRTLSKMQKMNEELQTLRKKHKADDSDVEPWWV